MILFFSNVKVSQSNKILRLVERAKTLYNSDFYDVEKEKWFGDKLTIESLFPSWIIKEYEENSNSVIIPIIKNYLRWLFSLEYGYGAQLNWENIRTPLYANSIFLEAYLDFYFYKSDIKEPSASLLNNMRNFSLNCDTNYFNIKGTPAAIKYLICNLFGVPWDFITVETANSSIINVTIKSDYQINVSPYESFLNQHVYPAGMSVVYTYY